MAWYDNVSQQYVANIMNTMWQEETFDPFSLFPVVTVKKDSGMIAEYKKEDLLRIGNTDDYKNIPGAPVESKGDTLEKNFISYVLDEYRFHKLVTKNEVDNADSPYKPISDASRFVIQRIKRLLIKDFVENFMKTGVWSTELTGGADFTKWSDPSSDPIGDVFDWKEAVLKVTGYEVQRMGITYDVYTALRKNPTIKSDLKVTSDKVVTVDKLRQLFDLEELVVLKTVETTARKGEIADDSNTDFVASNKVLLVYAPANPSTTEPSAGYHLLGKKTGRNITTKSIPKPDLNDALKIEGKAKVKGLVTSPALGVLATAVV